MEKRVCFFLGNDTNDDGEGASFKRNLSSLAALTTLSWPILLRERAETTETTVHCNC